MDYNLNDLELAVESVKLEKQFVEQPQDEDGEAEGESMEEVTDKKDESSAETQGSQVIHDNNEQTNINL